MKSEKKISKKIKRISTHANFSNTWLESLKQKHHTWKNNEAQSPTNQMLKDEIGKKFSYTKGSKTQIAVKKMMIKIKIKNDLEDNYEFFIERWNWKEKSL